MTNIVYATSTEVARRHDTARKGIDLVARRSLVTVKCGECGWATLGHHDALVRHQTSGECLDCQEANRLRQEQVA